MNTELSTNHKLTKIFANILSIFAILAIAFPVTSVASAASSSPFVGHWQATDVDGSDIRLTIGGPPDGPFQITWTESYISFCNGEAGIIRGTGQFNASDPNLLEADLHLTCFTTGASLDFHFVWRYHPAANTLSSSYGNGVVTIWHRPGQSQPLPPALSLRVNYGHDWVESFYEGGHMAWVTVTESDGVTVKATAELVTEPKDFWGGETGFQTSSQDWIPAPPDIQPNDWVFGWVDNGASAQVQIGDISGMIHLASDSVDGTILAPWITDPVQVECLDWGSGGEPFSNKDGGLILANGEDPYSCSWAGEWDIQPYQDVGVGYFGPDGHWVANAFFARNPRIFASEAGDWFWTTDFNPGVLDLFIYESANEGATLLWQGTRDADESGFAFVGGDVHGQDLVPGNYVVVSDGVNEKGLVLETITMEVFDTENEIMAGTAPLGREVSAAAGPQDWQERIMVQADMVTGAWQADFKTIGFDITEEMRPWSFAQIFDEDGDANEGSTPPPPPTPVILGWLDWDVVEGNGWHIGDTVTLTIGDFTRNAVVEPASWDPLYGHVRFELGAEGYDLKIGDLIVMTDGITTKECQVPSLEVTGYDLGAHTISGIYDPNLSFRIGVNGTEPTNVAFDDNTWVATFDELGPNLWGDAIQTDNDGDDIRATIHTPNPNLYALADEDKIFAQEWIVGRALELKIYSPNGEEIYSDSQMVEPPSEVPWTVVIFEPGVDGFDLLPGQRIVLNQGGYERELAISSLQIIGFDLTAQTVFGTGNPGANFLIRINGLDIWSTVKDDGTWSVYHELLQPGVWGEAIQPDADGDETRDGFQAPFE